MSIVQRIILYFNHSVNLCSNIQPVLERNMYIYCIFMYFLNDLSQIVHVKTYLIQIRIVDKIA